MKVKTLMRIYVASLIATNIAAVLIGHPVFMTFVVIFDIFTAIYPAWLYRWISGKFIKRQLSWKESYELVLGLLKSGLSENRTLNEYYTQEMFKKDNSILLKLFSL